MASPARTEEAALTTSETHDPAWALPNSVEQQPDGSYAILCGKCQECATVVFPKPPICPTCLSTDIEVSRVSEGGTLYSYSVVHAARAGWQAPYGIAYVDFPQGVRICGPLELTQGADIALDAPVRVLAGTLRTDAGGKPVLSHRFEAVTTSGSQS